MTPITKPTKMPADSSTYPGIDVFVSSDASADRKNIASGFVICTNCRTFGSTVHTTLPTRTASQGVSFAFIPFAINITTLLSANHGIS